MFLESMEVVISLVSMAVGVAMMMRDSGVRAVHRVHTAGGGRAAK